MSQNMPDVDTTAKEMQATIARMDALLLEGEAMTARSQAVLDGAGALPGIVQSFVARQTPEQQTEFAREVKELEEEIERDLPRQTATRPMKLKPARQMI